MPAAQEASPTLLTRDGFREHVFSRDHYSCVVCGAQGNQGQSIDAHHIVERRLFGIMDGYYLDNGATLCSKCHLEAESTILSAETIREKAGITTIILPDHLYPDEVYDKWGNVILPNGQRLRGELFYDPGAQIALAPVLHLFTTRVKYPRTYHLPWSEGKTSDDRVLPNDLGWNGTEIVVTEKMDGENTTLYRDFIHARSLTYESHPSRSRIKALHRQIAHEIPDGWRICGENLTAKHSIEYKNLPSHFLVFGIWNGNICLNWEDTVVYAGVWGLHTVPILHCSMWDRYNYNIVAQYIPRHRTYSNESEGYVIRPAAAYSLAEHRYKVGKCVRAGHVQTQGNWMRQKVEYNGVVGGK
jgi:hypothetical protein